MELDLQDREYEAARLAPEAEIAVYRIIQEALTNVARHAQARQVLVRISSLDGSVLVEIQDDGIGFDAGDDWWAAVSGRHFGLLGMRERALALGGKLKISSQSGQGTRVALTVPCGGPPEVER
jgi:signal transduction histidine kinase